MKVVVGVDRLTIEPETDSDRVLLLYWREREGQKVSVEWDEFSEVIEGFLKGSLCLYVNFDLITEENK